MTRDVYWRRLWMAVRTPASWKVRIVVWIIGFGVGTYAFSNLVPAEYRDAVTLAVLAAMFVYLTASLIKIRAQRRLASRTGADAVDA